MKALAAELNMY